jgi:tetratricopeptide (TPR) repeat protein
VPPESPLSALQRQLNSGQYESAIQTADSLLATHKRSLPAWLARARANLNLGRVMAADADVDQCLRLAPGEPQASLIRAQIDQRLGRVDAAAERLRALASMRGPMGVEATVLLAEVLHFGHRTEDLRTLVESGGEWSGDPRSRLAAARTLSGSDPERSMVLLREIAVPSSGPALHRIAGFELVQMLDRAGRYREAFDLAVSLHEATTPPFDVGGLEMRVAEQLALLARGTPWFTPRAVPVTGVAMLVGLPRSGTTLLAQMLDRHPSVCSIGEYEGIDRLGEALVSLGRWPRDLGVIRPEMAAQVQSLYTAALPRLRREGCAWTLDKTLSAWMWLPAVSCILPGAVCVRIERDPRDCAISMFLSHFNPRWYGWMRSLASIRTVMGLYRDIVPLALDTLGIAYDSVAYESLVHDPAANAGRCIARLGLEMDEAVLSPERNARPAYTLSHAQVRRPINADSIGRWRNYPWAFDSSWDDGPNRPSTSRTTATH